MKAATKAFLESMYSNVEAEETRNIQENVKKEVLEKIKTMLDSDIISIEEAQEFARDKGIDTNKIKKTATRTRTTTPSRPTSSC